MDLGKGPRHPSMLVKKLNEKSGKLSRTKYFIRIGESNMMPEIKETVHLPDGGFIVPMQVDIGSSDFMRPQVPSPGDVRRMFGNHKIDSEPEYARGMDPDWSRVSPTTPTELENKVREWNAATNAVLRKYRDIEERRLNFDKKTTFAKVNKRTRSEGCKRKNLRRTEKRFKSAGTNNLKKNKNWRNWPLKPLPNNNVPINNNVTHSSEQAINKTEITQNALVRDGTVDKPSIERIPYSPQKIKIKSYNNAISVVQKMDSDHWIMIDKLYNDIKREKGINFDMLNTRVMKIVRDIYGVESEFILSTIHSNPVQRIIKLGKLMLNVYHEAMYGNRKKTKLLVPGINNQHFAKKCLQAYTYTPQYRTTRMTSKMYERLTASQEKPPKCIACYKKNMERENNIRKIMEFSSRPRKTKQMKKKCRLKQVGSERLPRSNLPKLNSSNSSKSSNLLKQKEETFNDIQKNTNLPKSQMMFYVPPFLAKEPDEKSISDLTIDHFEDFSSSTFASKDDKSIVEIESLPNSSSVKMIDKTDEEETIKSSSGNMGGGDSLVQFSNDYNYLLSSLYESSSNISLELSKKLTASPIMATFGGTSEKCSSDRFFASTANILQLNEQLENMLFKENRNESSRAFRELSENSEDENYIDCQGVEHEGSSIFLSNNQVNIQKKSYKYSKWMRLTDDCFSHRGYITFFMSIMLGLTTAIFCHDSFLNHINGDPSLKDGVKQVIKTFLLGALRLVDGF